MATGFYGLDNEEIIFVYLSNRKFLEQYEAVFKSNGLESSIELPENTYVVKYDNLTEEDLLGLANDPHYLYCIKVNEKLEPVVDLIRESFPEIYDKVLNTF